MCDGSPTTSGLQILADYADNGDAQLRALLHLGLSEADARRFMAFMPSGLARPIVESFGVEVIDEASVLVGNDQMITFSLSNQELYGLAVNLGRAHRERGVLPHEVFRKIVENTAEIEAIDKLFSDGGDPEGGAIAICFTDARLAHYLVDPSAPQPATEADSSGKLGVLSRLWPKSRTA